MTISIRPSISVLQKQCRVRYWKTLSFVKDANANSKPRLFMWKMKKLKMGGVEKRLARDEDT